MMLGPLQRREFFYPQTQLLNVAVGVAIGLMGQCLLNQLKPGRESRVGGCFK